MGLHRIGNTTINPSHRATCHCGAVELMLDLPDGVVDPRRCNCSYCRRRGTIVASVALDGLHVVQGAERLKVYQFNTRTAKHYFCGVCGIHTHHQRRSHPELYAYNVGCLEGVDPFALGEVPTRDGIHHPSDRASMKRPAEVFRYAVFGHPVAHSLSPRLHALFAAQVGVELEYIAIDAAPDAFADAVRGFLAEGGRGANVTVPHKPAAFALATTHTAAARRLGVANVLTRLPDGGIEADSNDGAGLLADLRARCAFDVSGRRVLLLGAGGAARAAAFALLDAGIGSLVIVNRTLERAHGLAQALAQSRRIGVAPWQALDRSGRFDLIVHATSAGVQHHALALPDSLVGADTVAYDLSYGPAAQSFVGWAKAAGAAAVFDGIGMLVATAAASFERWHGVRPDAGAALRALEAGLR